MDKSKAEFFEFHPETIQIVRKLNNLDAPGRLEDAVDLLEEWVKMQNHFVTKDFPRIYLETCLTTNKGLMEPAKKTLDQLCTFKTLKPDYFPMSIKRENFRRLEEVGVQALLPRLTKEHYRVGMIKKFTDDVDAAFFQNLYQFCVMAGEYCKMHDYNAGYVLILDYRSINPFALATKANVMEIRQFYTVMSKGYGMRIKGIHLISRSKLLEPMLAIAKAILGPKLTERLQLHENLDTLHEAIDKDVLPEEYGGKEKSLQALSDECLDLLCSKDQTEFFQEIFKAKTDETRRKVDVFNDNYIGMPGSFRALSVD